MKAKTEKVKFPYTIMRHDVTDAEERLHKFVQNRFAQEVGYIKIYWNGGAYVGFRFFVGRKEYYWIPSNYDGCYEISGINDILAFVQKLQDTQHPEFPPHWWILKIGNSNGKKTEKVEKLKGDIVNSYGENE